MEDNKKKPHYEVGYRKPPQHSRFKPGESGNPKGKPKGTRGLATIVGNAITEKVIVTENGKRKSVSKLEVAVKQLINKAASGDHKSMQQLLPLVQLIEGRAEAAAAVTTPTLAEADHLVMASIGARFRQRAVEEMAKLPQETTLNTTNEEKTHE